jgi:HEPN domain-containing protein
MAEADDAAALLLRRSRKKGTRELVCFHLRQCLEKYLKARLVEGAISFPRTHDLERLLELALPSEPMWSTLRPVLASITDYAVEARYLGIPRALPRCARRFVPASGRAKSSGGL